MKQEPFVIERILNAPVARVWKAITDNAQMKQWYFDIPAFEPVVGFEFEFSGGPDHETFRHLCKVLEAVPNKKLVYSWRYDGYEGNSIVTFELFAENDKTRLKLTHEGLETFPQDKPEFARNNFAMGWTDITGVLLPSFVEVATIMKSITINAGKERVWDVLTKAEHNRQWANEFSEGTYVETDWKQGADVIWKDKDGNIGASGRVDANEGKSLITVAFPDDTGADDALSVYYESYRLAEKDDKTILSIEAGPLRQKHYEMHEPLWDKALAKIKEVAEA